MTTSLKKICFLPTYKAEYSSLTNQFLTTLFSATDKITIITDEPFKKCFLEVCKYLVCASDHDAPIKLLLQPSLSDAQLCEIGELGTDQEKAKAIIDLMLENCETVALEPYTDIIHQLFSATNIQTKIYLNKDAGDADCGKTGNCFIFEGICDEAVAFTTEPMQGGETSDNINVKWSWGDPTKNVKKKQKEAQTTWEGTLPGNPALKIDNATISEKIDDKLQAENPSGITLYEHQEKAVNKWVQHDYRGILKMCTGAGKTITALASIRRLQSDLKEEDETLSVAVVVCPRKILVEQWNKEVKKFGFRHAPLLAYDDINKYADRIGIALNHKRHPGLTIVITTYDTFGDNRFRHKIIQATRVGTEALLIADEMHNLSSSKSRKRIKEYGDYFKYRLGLSATPDIEGDEPATKDLFEYFGDLLSEYNISDAINDEVLCPYRYYPVPAFLDSKTSQRYFELLSEIHSDKKIDINIYRQRGDLLRRSEVYLDALKEVLDTEFQLDDLDHTLTFCPPGKVDSDQDVRLIQKVKKIYQDRSVICSSITQKTGNKERIETLQLFHDGFFKVLLAIGCLDEGFDLPSTKIAIMLYSVDRERQFIQRRGRVLRKFQGKKYAIIYDVIILPHNTDLNPSDVKRILKKEMRRYTEFSRLAINSDEARKRIDDAIKLVTRS